MYVGLRGIYSANFVEHFVRLNNCSPKISTVLILETHKYVTFACSGKTEFVNVIKYVETRRLF